MEIEVIKWGAYVITSIIGWFVSILWSDGIKIKAEMKAMELLMADSYVKKDDLKEALLPLFKKLDRMEELFINHLEKKAP